MLPYTMLVSDIPQLPFVDYKTGRKYTGMQYWKTLDEVYSGYFNHKESKFDGTIGQLNRKLISINNIIHIGKESSGLELDYILGLSNLNGDICEEYGRFNSTNKVFNVNKSKFNSNYSNFTFKFRKRSKLRKLVDKQFNEIQDWILQLSKVNLVQFGISKKVLYRTKMSIRLGHVQKLSKNTKLKFINCHHKLAKTVTCHQFVTNSQNVTISPLLPAINEVKEVIVN